MSNDLLTTPDAAVQLGMPRSSVPRLMSRHDIAPAVPSHGSRPAQWHAADVQRVAEARQQDTQQPDKTSNAVRKHGATGALRQAQARHAANMQAALAERQERRRTPEPFTIDLRRGRSLILDAVAKAGGGWEVSDNYSLDDWLRNASEDTRRLNEDALTTAGTSTLPEPVTGPGVTYTSAEDQLGALIAGVLNTAGLDPATLEREYKFHRTREWRFDYALPGRMLAFECEGGTRMKTSGGYSAGHAHPERFEEDCEKYNEAALDGWRVLRFTPAMVRDGRALATVQAAIAEAS